MTSGFAGQQEKHTFSVKDHMEKNMAMYVEKIQLDLLNDWTNSLRKNSEVVFKLSRCTQIAP